MNRRKLIGLIGSVALGGSLAWPIVAMAQQSDQMRRVGILLGMLPAEDPEARVRTGAFVQRLQELGWIEGRNLHIDYRHALGDPDRLRRSASELVALAPDALLAGGTPAAGSLQQATRHLPIVFANVGDPVGMGYVSSLARPGGNITGFMNVEFGVSAKWLELLKQLTPRVTRVAIVRNPEQPVEIGQFAAIRTVAPSLGVDLIPIDARSAAEMERGVSSFVRGSTDGLIVTATLGQNLRDLIVALADRHRLPAVYPFRRYVIEGGLVSFGPNQAEPYRQAADYVARIFKGEKPADLPVQAPTKYETIINLKTAKTLGLDMPAAVFARADEVIE